MLVTNAKTHYTLLQSINKPNDIAKQCLELGYDSCVIADLDSISGTVDFSTTLQKKGVKPILGCEFSVIEGDAVYNQILLARSQEGWKNLLELLSRSYDDDRFLNGPSLTWDIICEHGKGLLGYSGKYFNALQIMGEKNKAIAHLEQLKSALDEVFVSNDLKESGDIAKLLNLKVINTKPAFYASKEDARYQRLVLCTSMNSTFSDIDRKIQNGDKLDNHQFFASDNFYILPKESIGEEELDNAKYIESLCDVIQLERKPSLPRFDCPDGLSEKDYLLNLCEKGIDYRKVREKPEYLERLKYELGVINSYDVLNTYFLITQDFVSWAKNQGWLVGPSRGCFTPDTRVQMSDLTYKPISLIDINDKVIDAYGKEQIVTNILEYDIDEEILELEFENNKIIRCTKDHKFLTNNRGWVEAQYLTELDDIVEIQQYRDSAL